MTSTRIIKDYNLPDGGSYDLLILAFPEGYPNSKIGFSLASLASGSTTEGVSRRVNGVQKVAQQFISILCTRKGTDALNPNNGTTFPDIIRMGNIQSKGSMEALVRQDIIDAENQIKAFTSFKRDPGERLASVELTRLDVGLNSISLGLRLITDDGEYASVYVPFPRYDLELN